MNCSQLTSAQRQKLLKEAMLNTPLYQYRFIISSVMALLVYWFMIDEKRRVILGTVIACIFTFGIVLLGLELYYRVPIEVKTLETRIGCEVNNITSSIERLNALSSKLTTLV